MSKALYIDDPTIGETQVSYSHYFYAVDLDKLKKIAGSGEMKSVAPLVKSHPTIKLVLEAIVSGNIDQTIEPADYGYALMALCKHVGGERIGREVADVRDHPYDSQLAHSGSPISIPYDAKNFPQIGFLAASEVEEELARLDAAPPPTGKPRFPGKKFPGKMPPGLKLPGKRRGDEAEMAAAIADDVASYRETLIEAREMGRAIVSFRH